MSINEKGKIYNLIWAIFEKTFQIFLTLLMTGMIARYFGVEQFGYYQYALTILFIATTLTWICSSEVFYSHIDSNGELGRGIIITSILYRLFISIITYSLFTLYFYIISDMGSIRNFVLIMLITLLFSEPLGIYRILLECKGYYYITSKIRLFSLIVKVLIVYILIEFNVNYNLLLFSVVVETILSGCLFYYVYIKTNPDYKLFISDFNFKWVKLFFSDGIKFWLGLIAMNLFTKIDRFFMERNLNSIDFGHYSVSLSTYEQYVSIASILIAVLAPMLIYRSKERETKKNILYLSIVVFILGVTGAIVLYFTANFFITLIYGSEFSDSVKVFKYFIIFGPIAFLDLSLSTLLIKDKCASFFTIKWLTAFLVGFFINKYMFSFYGVYTGVIGYGSGIIISLIFSLIYVLVIRKDEFKKYN